MAAEVGQDGRLELTHEHETDGRGLDLGKAERVLEYVHKAWGRTVRLQTVDADGKEKVLTRE